MGLAISCLHVLAPPVMPTSDFFAARALFCFRSLVWLPFSLRYSATLQFRPRPTPDYLAQFCFCAPAFFELSVPLDSFFFLVKCFYGIWLLSFSRFVRRCHSFFVCNLSWSWFDGPDVPRPSPDIAPCSFGGVIASCSQSFSSWPSLLLSFSIRPVSGLALLSVWAGLCGWCLVALCSVLWLPWRVGVAWGRLSLSGCFLVLVWCACAASALCGLPFSSGSCSVLRCVVIAPGSLGCLPYFCGLFGLSASVARL